MESVHSNTSRRSEDPNKNATNSWKHHHNEHMLGTASNILSSARQCNEPQT
ncbi:hypothetical protein AHAS_Ahas09G0134200 [Arachis hypogaea]